MPLPEKIEITSGFPMAETIALTNFAAHAVTFPSRQVSTDGVGWLREFAGAKLLSNSSQVI